MDFFQAIVDEEVRPRTREKQVRIVIVEVLRALRSLHEAGLVHRDVKLENVVFQQRGRHNPRYEKDAASPRSASSLRRQMNNEFNFPPNFEGLVLGCIDADFSK